MKVKKAASPVGCWSGAEVKVLGTEKTKLNQMPGLSGEVGQKDTKVRKKLELHLKNNLWQCLLSYLLVNRGPQVILCRLRHFALQRPRDLIKRGYLLSTSS